MRNKSYTLSKILIFCLARKAYELACILALCPQSYKVTPYPKMCNFSNFCNFCNRKLVTPKVTGLQCVTFSGMACKAVVRLQSYRSYTSYRLTVCNFASMEV